MNFKQFLALFKDNTPPPPKREMTIDQEQAAFERDVLFNELKKRGFRVGKNSWNVITCQVGPLDIGLFIGGIGSDHDLWDIRHVDTSEKVQQEVYETRQADVSHVISTLEAWRKFYSKK